jgi:hypothetical protein
LQRFAIRLLSQPCSASGCERNWSVFERIHTKKRNRLEQKRLNDLVFVQYNLRLRRNQLLNKRLDTDPIVLDDVDPTSDWVAETHPPEFDVDHDIEIDSEKKEETIASPPSTVQRETVTYPIDPIDLVDVPRDIAVGQKRPAWARQTLQEAEGHVAPRGTF